MRRVALIVLAGGALLLSPRAPGLPDVPGDPTPPVVTPVITGTLGDGGWYTTNVTVNWSVVDPESIILSTSGCNTVTLNANTTGTQLTCTAESDGGTTTVGKTFRIDKTGPAASASPSRLPDTNGWYNHALSVDFAGTDGTSGLASCTATQTYSGPDVVSTTVAGTCRDKAGNTTPASLALKYDATAPSATGAARPPDANGWHNHAVTVNFQGADATAGIAGCTQVTYAGPDDPSVALSGTCVDQAGNQSSSSVFTLKYDETDPAATATASRAPDVDGWYNHALSVSFAATDATSGVESCEVPKSYAGPDAAATSVTGACRDRAGNVASPGVAIKYDGTAPGVTATPSRAPAATGWYTAALSVTFAGTDATSGVDSCAAPKSYAGPDAAGASVSGTCTDRAGNTGSTAFGLKYDATAPATTASPARTADANGWYNHSLAVAFAGTDATSGIDSCDAAKTYAGPDTATASVSGACRDRAGNSSSSTFDLKYDATAPVASAAASRQPNANGWYNAPLTVAFSGSDATSGLAACDASRSYGGPDNGAAAVSGSCTDVAGNAGFVTLALKYDATAPATTATPSLQPNAAGWYRTPVSVTFGATDATSGIESCDAAKSYAGPDTGSASLSGACRDRAGNSSSAALPLKYDATAPAATATPARQPNANGWFNAPLVVDFAATDATSGVETCAQPRTYSGPDSGAASVAGTCTDRAGNADTATFGLQYDATAPAAAATPSRQPNANGWLNAPVSVSFAGTDATSTIDSCEAPKSYSGPDASSAAVTGTCRDKAGNVGGATFPLKYDATAPVATATPARQPNAAGWYNAALAVTFAATDATSAVESCDAAKTYAGPDDAAASVTGTCRDRAGNSSSATLPLKYDATAPATTAAPSRGADANGWYNHALTVSFSGTDATSTVASCEAAKTFSGPDSPGTSVTGTCTDRAGNVGAASLALKYDATAPQSTATPSRAPNANGWYSAPVSVSFAATDATSAVASCDAPKAYSGPDTASQAVTGSCRDVAGNASGASFAVRYDATPPVPTATPARPPNANGWFNAPVGVTFSATDAMSTVASCDAAKTYGGPDSGAASVTGRCTDKAGNSADATLGLKYDATSPVATAAASRTADSNGWYNAPLGVSFSGVDSTSGIQSCDASKTYAGPDTVATTVSGSCTDKAGNAATGGLALKFDATAPAASATPSREPNPNGWYNAPLSVSFAATDATSGVASCPQPQPYEGPDTATAVVSGTCLDKAGNGALASLPVRYDTVAPAATASTRAPDRGSWFNRPLTVSFAGTDATSGIEACTPPQDYAGPDRTGASASGSCRDRAGNQGSATRFDFDYDGTPPDVTGATAARPPDRADWYNRPVSFAVTGADATSGLDACPPVTYSGPDAAAGAVDAACVDNAGNRASRPFPIRYDATVPTASAAAGRAPDANGWYNRPLGVSFSGNDAVSGLESCSPDETYAGPDNALALVGGTCADKAGNVGVASLGVPYDATAPTVTGVDPSRPPDLHGWYNRPLVVRFRGTDATSEIAVCTETTYGGPDATAATVTGSCRDRAGNTSGEGSFSLRYDSTSPTVNGLTAKAGNGEVAVSWATSTDTAVSELRRSGVLIYRGAATSYRDRRVRNGVRYRYELSAYDEAGNAATRGIAARPTAPLIAPPAGAAVSRPPRLVWTPVRGATYYNVQLWRRGLVLSAWPKRASLRLTRTWTYTGRRHRLTPGRYRWYVWPGYGRIGDKRFGRLLGSSSFVVR